MLEALTVNDMSNRILEREEFSNDNDMIKKNYKREMIRMVLNAYIEEMRLAFIDGERIYLPGVGTLIPELLIPEGSYYNLPACNKKDIAPPYTNLRFSRNQNLKNDMNRRLRENIENKTMGLEYLPFTDEQVDALKESGYIKQGSKSKSVKCMD